MKEGEEIKCVVIIYLFVSINVILSITSLLGNILILVALRKASSFHPPSKLLFFCLSCTDLLVGVISQPMFVVFLTAATANNNEELSRKTQRAAFISSSIFCGESIAISTAISVDRLLALLMKLRYRQTVTLPRGRLLITLACAFCMCLAMTYLWDKRFFFIASSICIGTCISISSCCYLKIYVSIRRQQAQVQTFRPHPGASMNLAWYKKSVSSALWIHLTQVVCYPPYTIVAVLGTSHSLSYCTAISWNMIGLLVYLNPFLYCWKIREVRQAAKGTLKRWFCLS